MLGFATEELAVRVGDAFGGLLNATFGCVCVCLVLEAATDADAIACLLLAETLSN